MLIPFSSIVYCLFFTLLPITGISQISRLLINDLVRLLRQMIAGHRGEFDEGIEIYKAEHVAVCMAGFYVTDDFSIPNTIKIR